MDKCPLLLFFYTLLKRKLSSYRANRALTTALDKKIFSKQVSIFFEIQHDKVTLYPGDQVPEKAASKRVPFAIAGRKEAV
jgi:hypothetical protein